MRSCRTNLPEMTVRLFRGTPTTKSSYKNMFVLLLCPPCIVFRPYAGRGERESRTEQRHISCCMTLCTKTLLCIFSKLMLHSVSIICSRQMSCDLVHWDRAHMLGRKMAFCQLGYALLSIFSTCTDSNLFGVLPLVVD